MQDKAFTSIQPPKADGVCDVGCGCNVNCQFWRLTFEDGDPRCEVKGEAMTDAAIQDNAVADVS